MQKYMILFFMSYGLSVCASSQSHLPNHVQVSVASREQIMESSQSTSPRMSPQNLCVEQPWPGERNQTSAVFYCSLANVAFCNYFVPKDEIRYKRDCCFAAKAWCALVAICFGGIIVGFETGVL